MENPAVFFFGKLYHQQKQKKTCIFSIAEKHFNQYSKDEIKIINIL
jgi:hypothetical protein